MKADLSMTACWMACISHARAANVPRMQGLVGPLTWYVGHGEGDAYRASGAVSVVESGALCRSRNHALEDANVEHRWCIQLSDDLRYIKMITSCVDGRNVDAKVSFSLAMGTVITDAKTMGARLGGAAPTSNKLFFDPRKRLSAGCFILGDFMAIRPGSLRFNEQMRLKEDYDFTLQHLKTFGVVSRSNNVMPQFTHRTNKGGAVDIRTPALEQEAIAQLKARWPAFIRDNPKRADEVILSWQ